MIADRRDRVELRQDIEQPDPDPTDDERIARKHPGVTLTDHFDFGPGFDPRPF